jgi:hypothetical protein
MSPKYLSPLALAALFAAAMVAFPASSAFADTITTNPYQGITYITRTETSPRAVTMHIAIIDLTAPGISFGVTSSSGVSGYETVRQTTTDFVTQEQAQLGINVAFFDPVTVPATAGPNVNVAGLIVSQGNFVSNFDAQPCHTGGPVQSYAIVPYAPALNIDASNHATIVHRDSTYSDNQHILENASLFNAVSGSAQIITDGAASVPVYKDANNPDGLLTIGTSSYSNSNSWYDVLNARTAIGLSKDGNTLVLFTVDKANGSGGMKVSEVANILLNDYHCYEALNLDGGGSTSMSLENPSTGIVSACNASADTNYPLGRPEGVNFAVFANPVPEPASMGILILGGAMLLARRRKA